MEKDSFLDTNIILHYSNYTDFSSKLLKRCYLFVQNKKSNFILCWAVIIELENVIKKRARVHKAVIEKIKDSSYPFDNNSFLSFGDIPDAKKLYERFKNKPLNEVKNIFDSQRYSSEIKIEKFMNSQVDQKVIPSNKINLDLANELHRDIENYSDCKILASALEFQQERDIFLFVTADGRDFNPNTYKVIKEQFEINNSNRRYKFPELLNLFYTD